MRPDVEGQRLIVEGWFASHADSGTPGPRIHLRTSDRQDPVLRINQMPSLITALKTVAEHIDVLWSTHGEQYAAAVMLRSPDPQDPAVVQQRLWLDGGWGATALRTARRRAGLVLPWTVMVGSTTDPLPARDSAHGAPLSAP